MKDNIKIIKWRDKEHKISENSAKLDKILDIKQLEDLNLTKQYINKQIKMANNIEDWLIFSKIKQNHRHCTIKNKKRDKKT